jgi:RHS repeat-associated protein
LSDPGAWGDGAGAHTLGTGATERYVYAGLQSLPGTPFALARQRAYDATVGRFTSVDPIGLAGGDNRFVYGNGDPLGHVDPEGLTAEPVMGSASTPGVRGGAAGGFWDPGTSRGGDGGGSGGTFSGGWSSGSTPGEAACPLGFCKQPFRADEGEDEEGGSAGAARELDPQPRKIEGGEEITIDVSDVDGSITVPADSAFDRFLDDVKDWFADTFSGSGGGSATPAFGGSAARTTLPEPPGGWAFTSGRGAGPAGFLRPGTTPAPPPAWGRPPPGGHPALFAAVAVVVAGVHLYQTWDDETGLSGSGKSSAPFGPQFALPRRTETDADGTQREWDGAKWRVKYAPKGSAHAVGSGVTSAGSLAEANRVIRGIEGSSGAGGASGGAPELPAALRGGEANAHVYLGVRDGEAVYAGITNNPVRRAAEHGARFDVQPITPSPLTRGEARAVEQALIERNLGFENIRNSISPSHSYYQ